MLMIKRLDLRKIARARIKDGEILFRVGRYDGALYLCGYAVEMALKARICKTLHWDGYPENAKEFHNFKTFKTHDFDTLLRLSGLEEKIKINKVLMADWSVVGAWDPKIRYNPIGTAKEQEVNSMIQSSKKLVRVL
jgi:hypothetical protein